MSSLSGHAPDERGRGPTADAIALVRPFVVVVAHEVVEGPLQRRATGEVAATEDDAPELLENRALQPFDEPVGPGMARFRPRMAEVELAAGHIKGALEFRAAVGEYAPHRPPRSLEVGLDDLG